MKLTLKIVIYISVLLVLFVGTMTYIVFGVIQPRSLNTFRRTTLENIAVSLIYEVSIELQTNDYTRAGKVFNQFIQLEGIYGLVVYDATGSLRFSSLETIQLPPQLDNMLLYQIVDDQQPVFREETLQGTPVYSLFYPVSHDNTVIGVLKLILTFESLEQYQQTSTRLAIIVCGLGLASLIILIYVVLSRQFCRIRAVITKMDTIIRERDLTQRVVVERSDEIGELGDVFNKMADRLLHVTREIQRAGFRVTTSTEQIVEMSRSHQEAAEALMGSVEEVNIGIEELKKLAEQISGKAETVLSNAEYTLRNTIEGVEVVEELVTEMNDIDMINREGVRQVTELIEKAEQITEIVTIIEDITANTKLIAFNATIEAARAGESGKGFSVVANEIRNLADNISVATSNIRKIIQAMQEATTRSAEIEAEERERVEHGAQIVNRTKEHLDLVLKMLDDTVHYAREISLATEEQKHSNVHIIERMHEFLEIAQFTKNTSMQTSASARELDRLADEMQATVEQVKLD